MGLIFSGVLAFFCAKLTVPVSRWRIGRHLAADRFEHEAEVQRFRKELAEARLEKGIPR